MAAERAVIVLASQNAKKLKEMHELLGDFGYIIISAAEAGFSEQIEETGESFAQNACIKAETICKALGCWAIADDSGLQVDALEGAPGIYSARYAGVGSSDEENNLKLLHALMDVADDQRGACFVSVIALARPNSETLYFEGVCPGFILEQAKGDLGFGYDPLFVPLGESRSFAELSASQKHSISHRGIAMNLLKEYLLKLVNKES